MLKEKIFKEQMSEYPALSCIESYLFYIMEKQDEPIAYLFYNSFISIEDIIYEFTFNSAVFASFYKLKRLQNIAKESNIIDFTFKKGPLKESDLEHFDYAAVEIMESELYKKYGRKMMRDDHFILITDKNQYEYYYLNENPRDDGSITKELFKKIYGGSAFLFSITDTVKNIDLYEKNKFIADEINSYLQKNHAQDILEKMLKKIETPEKARDIIGILKITRKRIAAFDKLFSKNEWVDDYLQYLDNIYSKIEYMRLRKDHDPEKIRKIIYEVVQADKKIIENFRVSFFERSKIAVTLK